MPDSTRRGLLYGAGASLVALAGCSSTQKAEQTGELVTETVEIEAGEHRHWKFVTQSNVFFNYAFTVSAGPPIDAILMREHGYTDYRADNEFVHYQDGSVMDSSGDTVEVGLSKDNMYYFVLDNTKKGEAVPPPDSAGAVATVAVEAAVNAV